MALFGFGKKKEEDEDLDFDKGRGERGRKINFKKEGEFLPKHEPEKRKKKFEIVPWTKWQRIFVLVVFLSTITLSALLAMSAREWKLPNLPRIQFALPSFLSQEPIVIEGKKENVASSKAIKAFREGTTPLSGVYGFFVMRTADGSFYGDNEKEVFEAGSLNKLPVMIAMYWYAEQGALNLSTKYVLRNEDKVEGSGSLASSPAGTQITYQELVKKMGKESDNTAFKASRRILGDERIFAVMDEIGINHDLLLKNETTPYEVGRILRQLITTTNLSEESRDAILSYLTNTNYENWIARDIPVEVAHKYGTLTHVRNDAGIVFADEPFILVIMSKGIMESEADEFIPQVAREIFELESKDR